jgi:hypothetical protein
MEIRYLTCFLLLACIGRPSSTVAEIPGIYQCELQGQRVFSDRPCDASARVVAIDSWPLSVYEHPKSQLARGVETNKTTQRGSKKAAPSAAPTEDEPDRKRAACARLATSIDWIHSKQRAGYRAKEGVRLDERLRKLEEERRTKGCRL